MCQGITDGRLPIIHYSFKRQLVLTEVLPNKTAVEMSLKKQVLQMVMLAVAGVFLAPDVCLGLKIGAFNVQVLGQTKIMNFEVVNTLVKV